MESKSISPKRILVVDDEPDICQSVMMLLTVDGHKVTAASNAVEALELIGRNGYDLVITDFEMPGMKGDELAATIKIRIPSIPVIMITAYAEMFEGGKRPLPGVDSLLSKPFPLSGLRSAIAKAFQGGKPA